MPVNSLNSPVQNPAETFRINQANSRPLREPSEKRQQSDDKDIFTVEISAEAQALFEKAAEKKTEQAEKILEDRDLQKELSRQAQEEQARLNEESRKKIDLIT